MRQLLFFALATSLVAQEAEKPPATPPPATNFPLTPQSKSLITLDAKARANDYVHAFDMLKKDKPTLKIMVRTTSNTFSNVTDIAATQGGTLLLVKLLSTQGSRIQIVPIEEIVEINYSP